MSYQFAGRWGPQIFMDSDERLLKSVAVYVYLPGTQTVAQLYLNRTKAVGPNPFFTDQYGNGSFFADPGEYDIQYGDFSYPLTVSTDFAEGIGASPEGAAGGVLGGTYPAPGWGSFNPQTALGTHEADTTAIHGIADTSLLTTNAIMGAAIQAAVDDLLSGVPGTLDTLSKLAAAVNNDPAFYTTLTDLINAKVSSALFDANTILKADTDDTPVALPVPASTLLGRLASGDIEALTVPEVKSLLAVAVADISDFNTGVRLNPLDQMAVPTATVSMGGFNLGSLPTPTLPGHATSKGYVDAAIATAIGGTWTAPTLQNGWVNYGLGYAPVGYMQVGGFVIVRGAVKDGASTIFTLPVGLRPQYIHDFTSQTAAVLDIITVFPNGTIIHSSGSSAGLSLSVIQIPIGG